MGRSNQPRGHRPILHLPPFGDDVDGPAPFLQQRVDSHGERARDLGVHAGANNLKTVFPQFHIRSKTLLNGHFDGRYQAWKRMLTMQLFDAYVEVGQHVEVQTSQGPASCHPAPSCASDSSES